MRSKHEPNDRVRFAKILGLLGSLSFIEVYLETWRFGWSPVAIDFVSFWSAARLPFSTIYPSNLFVYPPTGLVFLSFFRGLPFWTNYLGWTAISIIAFFLAARRLVGTAPALLSLASMPAVFGILLGQTPMLLSSAVLLAVSLPSAASGAILGAALVIKPQLLCMAPIILMVRRDWHALICLTLSAISMILLATAVYGVDAWWAWLSALPDWKQVLVENYVFDHTITFAGLAMKLKLAAWPFLLMGILVSLIAAHGLSRKLTGAPLAALITCCSALASPYALPHDLVAAMPALASSLLATNSLLEFGFGACLFSGLQLTFVLPLTALFGSLHGSFPMLKLSHDRR